MTSEELDALLGFLGPDRDQAAGRYETVRSRLTRFFQWKGCLEAEDLVDDVFDRVARRLAKGVEITSADHARFFQGVARLVFFEYGRKLAKKPTLLDTGKHPVVRPEEPSWSKLALLSCLEDLRMQDRDLILGYYDLESVVRPEDGETVLEQSAEGAKGSRRKRLADRFGLNVNSLRIRAHRIRSRLERCVRSRLDAGIVRMS